MDHVNPSLMMLNANVALQFSLGDQLNQTANAAEAASTAQVDNQTDWAGTNDTSAQLGTPNDANNCYPIAGDLLGPNNSPLPNNPDGSIMFYDNAEVQKMITYLASQANGASGDTLTKYQLEMQTWTNAGQASNAQSSNQQGSLKNTSDTWSQQLQAAQGNLSSAVQAGNTAMGLQSNGAQTLSAGIM